MSDSSQNPTIVVRLSCTKSVPGCNVTVIYTTCLLGGTIMIRARLLASVGVVLGFAALFPAASTQAQNPTSQAAAAHAAFDQQALWQTTKVYCDSCHFGPKARGKLNLQTLDLGHLDVNGATWE